MRPLHAVALGLVVIALAARVRGFDLYADWAGWLLVLWGTHLLRTAEPAPERRPALVVLAVAALVVSAVLWVPAAGGWLADAEPAVRWTADLPGLAYFVLLCHELAGAALRSRADDARAPRAAAWLRLASVLFALVLVAPVLVFGAGWSALEPAAGLAGVVAQLLTVVLCFAYAGRRWAGAPPQEQPGDPSAAAAPRS